MGVVEVVACDAGYNGGKDKLEIWEGDVSLLCVAFTFRVAEGERLGKREGGEGLELTSARRKTMERRSVMIILATQNRYIF